MLRTALTIECIPYGIDLDVFRPTAQSSARQTLGIRPDAKVILFVAAKVIQGRKGLSYLFEALHRVQSTDKIVLLTVGSAGSEQRQLQRFEQIHLGQVTDEAKLNLAYNAADVYVLPTLADNLPLTVQESLASGTPVVAFDVGGLPEMISHPQTGYLARYKDAADLAAGILTILDNAERREPMRQRCRAVAVERYALDLQATRYAKLYERAIRDHQKDPTEDSQ
jgi:glycosyltransferase involved in cell wall biosynthesis